MNTEREVILSVKRVTKNIRRKQIIKDISFDVRAGEIFGFLGPNGSGKTTTIRMLVDLIKPTSGTISICGFDVNRHPEEALKYIGCIVENPEMYSYLTGWENLEHFARMQQGITNERIEEVVEIVGMDQRIHDKVKTYSLGMRQRLGIAQALLGKPKLLILDEPTNGLDPKGIKELRAFIRSLADEGLSLFISSHLLSEIQLMCDRVAIISRGEVLAVGEVEQLMKQAEGYVMWSLSPIESGRRILESVEGIQFVEVDDSEYSEALLTDSDAVFVRVEPERIPELNRLLVQDGVAVKSVQAIRPSLEQLFLRMTEGERIE